MKSESPYIAHSLEETSACAADLVARLAGTPVGEAATVVGLEGELGAGKTAFTQSIARTLGVEEHVTSPTFVIEKIYKLSNKRFSHLIHIDAYRLEKGEELAHLGWNELIKDPKNLILIEWPQNVKEILPTEMYRIQFSVIDATTRKIEVRGLAEK
jgi:tRNA threonylcarbamoyladenosine biosynthesis protein TsaE